MYDINPPAIYAHESVVSDERCRARLNRVAQALQNSLEPIIFTDDDLPRLIKEDKILANRRPMASIGEIPDPILLFNTFRFDGRRNERQKWLKERSGRADPALLGYQPFVWFPAGLPEDPYRDDKVCRACWRLHFQNGCLHKCHYCSFGGLLVTMVNVEEYIAHLDQLIRAHPWQETYLLEDDADVLCLEPELGCLGEIIEYFGTLENRYLIIHTKSWNVDWMLDLKHNGNTIIVWSISGPTQSRVLEPVTGTTEERIEAARKCQEAGYVIRYKFKPIIPIRNWREEASETIEMLFDRTDPDVISLCCFMWTTASELRIKMDVSLLDPKYLAAADEAVEEMAHTRAKPFPEWVRAEIYEYYFDEIRRRNADVPVSLSTENWAMWRRLGPKLGCNALNYVCGCGPNSVPWLKKLGVHPFDIAEKSESPRFDLM